MNLFVINSTNRSFLHA